MIRSSFLNSAGFLSLSPYIIQPTTYVSVQLSTFSSNYAAYGGAIWLVNFSNGSVVINSTFTYNSAVNVAGALYLQSGTVRPICLFYLSSIYNSIFQGDMMLTNCKFQGNIADGASIYVLTALYIRIAGCTFSGHVPNRPIVKVFGGSVRFTSSAFTDFSTLQVGSLLLVVIVIST